MLQVSGRWRQSFPGASVGLLVLDQEWAYLDKETWACFPAGPATAATHAFVDFISTRFEILRFRPEMRHHLRILQDRR